MQTRRRSLVETLTNVGVGYLAAVASQVILFPFFGIAVSPSTHLVLGVWFTGISIVRSYAMRRLFNRWEKQH